MFGCVILFLCELVYVCVIYCLCLFVQRLCVNHWCSSHKNWGKKNRFSMFGCVILFLCELVYVCVIYCLCLFVQRLCVNQWCSSRKNWGKKKLIFKVRLCDIVFVWACLCVCDAHYCLCVCLYMHQKMPGAKLYYTLLTMRKQEMLRIDCGSWCWGMLGGNGHIDGRDSCGNSLSRISNFLHWLGAGKCLARRSSRNSHEFWVRHTQTVRRAKSWSVGAWGTAFESESILVLHQFFTICISKFFFVATCIATKAVRAMLLKVLHIATRAVWAILL